MLNDSPPRSIRFWASRIAGVMGRGPRYRTMVVVGLVGLIASVTGPAILWHAEQQRATRSLEANGELILSSTAGALESVTLRLHAVGGLYQSDVNVTQDEFGRFVANLGALSGLGAIAHMPIVSAGDPGPGRLPAHLGTPLDDHPRTARRSRG